MHSFHIPVMGIGFTIDTPLKVAQYGISSVISLVDDILIEKMREMYCKKLELPYKAITDKVEDFRAKRITSYLNMINKIVKERFEELKISIMRNEGEIEKYFNLLQDFSPLKLQFLKVLKDKANISKLQKWIKDNLTVGSIDVNIMTKLDKANYIKGEPLPTKYNDAHAALRGFANSNLNSSIILSAGMNPRLYSYFQEFEDFIPDKNGKLKKKIILKVSDYRSALIQGKLLAKKGLWVSEYRIESGLNCGGHAFPTDGNLLGPILEEFKNNRDSLINATYEILIQALKDKNHLCPDKPLAVKFTAQGGVGTAEEHQFLIDYYKIDSVGWATPFLLVPEVTNVDEQTQSLLSEAKERDMYLSNTSPLGFPFYTLKANTKDIKKQELIEKGREGSSCPKKFASTSKEFTEKAICLASRQYQNLKIKELKSENLSQSSYQKEYRKITEKSCICVGLGTSALLVNDLETKVEGKGVSVCPGPNLAYFSKIVSLLDMVNHIYGKKNLIERNDRPNMFVKELHIYVDYLKQKIEEISKPNDKQLKYFHTFQSNLNQGIEYYRKLLADLMCKLGGIKTNILEDLKKLEKELNKISLKLKTVVRVPDNVQSPAPSNKKNSFVEV